MSPSQISVWISELETEMQNVEVPVTGSLQGGNRLPVKPRALTQPGALIRAAVFPDSLPALQ